MIRTLKRKAAKRTCFAPSLPAANILVSPPDEDIPARKKPRLQALFPATASEADTLDASPDASVAVASPDAGGPVAVSRTQPNDGAARAPIRSWTPEENTKLTNAVKTTCKKKWGKEYKTDWAAIAALVPGRTKHQCAKIWQYILDSKSDETTPPVGKWTKEDDSTLKDAVVKHNGKNWAAISELVPGRTKIQCNNRWHDALHSESDETTTRSVGKWTKEEDDKLTDAVEKHNGKN
jgi:hypothetical protein